MKCLYKNSCEGNEDAVYEVEFTIPPLDRYTPGVNNVKTKTCKGCLEAIKRRVFKVKGGNVRYRTIDADEWYAYGYNWKYQC